MYRLLALLVLLVLTVTPVAAHTNHVSADAQFSSNGTVIVEAVFPAETGWVVLHRDDQGTPGEAIGSTQVTASGFQTDIPVTVDRNVWRNWRGPRRLHVVLHHADGDGQFEPGDDEPLTAFDAPVADRVPLAKGPAAYVTAEDFGPGSVTDGGVTLRTVRMPGDGFLVVRNGSANGRVVGHIALTSGTHRSVHVDLDQQYLAGEGREVTLFAGLSLDDGSGTLDDDDRLAVAGQPVGTVFGVRQAGTSTPTHAENGPRHTHTGPTGTTTTGEGPGFTFGSLFLAVVALLVIGRAAS